MNRGAASSLRPGATLVALAAVLLSASAVSAGPVWDWLCGNDPHPCPPPAYYSKWRFWTPGLARIDDYCHGPKIDVYAPNRHPEIPVDYTVLPFSCPPVVPGATIIPVPTPPATSQFKYVERSDQDSTNGGADKDGKAGKSDKTDKTDKGKPDK
jgi:hypothetical protein